MTGPNIANSGHGSSVAPTINKVGPRLLVIRLGSLGDLVHTIPAVAALRSNFPGARLDWVVEQRWFDLIQMVTVVDETISLQRTLSGQLAGIRQLRRARYDCTVDFQGLYKSALLGWFSGAPTRVGRNRQAAREPGAAFFYTAGVNPQGTHVAEMSMSLATSTAQKLSAHARSQAPVPAGGMQFPLQVPKIAFDQLASKLALEEVESYVVLSPGGGWRSKCWPPERYGSLCEQLWQRRGIRCVVNAGPGEEELALEVARTAGESRPVALELSLLELAALLVQARLVVAADTGPLHLAAALGTRVVALFGPTDASRNGPLPRGRVVRVASPESADRQRGNYSRSDNYSPEMMNLSVEQVLAAVEEEMGVNA